MALGDSVVAYGEGETFFFDGKSRYVLGDRTSDALEEFHGCLSEKDLKQVYVTVQNWAYRKLN